MTTVGQSWRCLSLGGDYGGSELAIPTFGGDYGGSGLAILTVGGEYRGSELMI